MLLTDGTAADARTVAQSLIECLRQTILTDTGVAIFATVSIGVASFDEAGRSAAEMLKDADGAMYEAKQTRDNWVEFRARDLIDSAESPSALKIADRASG